MINLKLNKLIHSLKSVQQNPKNPNYFEDFENIICQIGNLKDPNSISLLVPFLKDDSEELNLMWSIIHTIEIFEDKIYIKEILKVSPYLARHYSEWFSLIFIRIINSDSCKKELISQLRDASLTIKESVRSIIKNINQENPDALIRTAPVLAITE